ncbi:MAG: response regulator [Candidatus Kapabacteria bacterium]|nr:response regulator [Candidatus Kapabacteria bacterium]
MSQTKILIIDDDIRMESVMKRFLFEKKYTLTFANDGEQGIEKAKNLLPDIILCDIVMPTMDGFQVLQHLKRNPPIKPPVFIFLSAKSTTDDFLLGIAKGADGYLAKPISRNDLVETIESHTFQQSFK